MILKLFNSDTFNRTPQRNCDKKSSVKSNTIDRQGWIKDDEIYEQFYFTDNNLESLLIIIN